jgi:hypothetical protein
MEMIKKAIGYGGDHLLTIREFIEITKFSIDGFMLDNFFHNLNDDIPVYVTNELIEWCGFGGAVFKKQKEAFSKLLKNFKESIDYWSYTNKEYSKYYEKVNSRNSYPHPDNFIGKNKTNHLILTVRCFKLVMLSLGTNVAGTIKEHYIQMESLVHVYMRYQCIFLKLSYEKELEKLRSLEHIRKYSRLNRINELELKLQQKYKVGCVYFICDGEYTKIGYTYNLPNRLCELQTANPRELYVTKYYFVQFPAVEEAKLHKKHKSRRVRGEWFKF